MLLPSAFDCAPRIHPSRSLYPPAPTLLSPPPTSRPCPTSPVSSNIYSACRSLQSLITTTLPSTTPSSISRPSRTQPQLASPIALTSSTSAHSRKQSRPQQCATKISHPQPQTPPRSSRKRRRSVSEDTNSNSPSHDQETTPPSTPKRQRLYPPSLPLGLLPTDFSDLQETAANIPIPITPPTSDTSLSPCPTSSPSTSEPSPSSSPSHPSPTTTTASSSEDTLLISLILHKLRLKQSDWDACALRLGKGKDSIGERWKILLGEGAGVGGLRMGRGRGGRRRGGVEGMEFGGKR